MLTNWINELAIRFTHHQPNDEKTMRHEEVRNACKKLAELIIEKTPQSREQSLAITSLEEAMMWANTAISRNPLS